MDRFTRSLPDTRCLGYLLSMDTYRIVIVADDPLARAGLAALLTDCEGLHIAGQSAADVDLSHVLTVYRPNVVVWDAGFDPETAVEPLAEVAGDGTPVIVLLPDEEAAPALWAAGARGLLLRSAGPDRLHAAIPALACGLVVVDLALARALPLTRPQPPVDALTARELDVLRLLVDGLSNRAIAQRLDISEHTVKFHLNAILSKFGAQSRTEAVVIAIRLGLITV